MTWDGRRQPDDESEALDELLAAARWPEPEEHRVGRLRRQWQGLTQARHRRRLVRVAGCVAVAAALGGVIFVGRLLSRPDEPPGPAIPSPEAIADGQSQAPTTDEPPAPESPQEPPVMPKGPEVAEARGESRPTSRPATAYEELVLHALTRTRRPVPEAPTEDPVERAIGRRLDNPDSDLDQLAETLMADRDQHEMAIVWKIQESTGPRQVAAVELLGCVGGHRSVPLLIELSRRPAAHVAAVRALARAADAETVAHLAQAETDPELQQELLGRLLARQGRASLAAYLACIRVPATREAALIALSRATDPPVERLFEFFNSPRQSERFAAAVVLGRLDDPEIPRRLIRMVVHDTRRREAMVALVASSDDQAVRFVSQAGLDPSWKARLSEARFQAQSMVP